MKQILPPGWSRRRWLQASTAGAAGLFGAHAAAAPAPGARIEWPALHALDGGVFAPGHWAGTPMVVVFWATYCAYCQRHNAHLDKLFRTLDEGRLRILGVALDDDASAVAAYMRRHGYRFPVALGGQALRVQFTARRVTPITCTVGRDGRLLQCIPGEMAEDDVLELARLALPVAR